MAASFRASTLCPDARARPRFSAFVHPVRHLRIVFSHPPRRDLLGSPAASSEPRNPAQPGGVRDGVVPSPRHGWGLPHGGQLGHAFPSALSTGSTSRLTAQFFAFWPTAPSLAGTHCQSATSPVGLRRGLDFNQLEAGITPRHPPLLFKEGKNKKYQQADYKPNSVPQPRGRGSDRLASTSRTQVVFAV